MGCIAQRRHSCFSPSSLGLDPGPAKIFSLLLSFWTVEILNPSYYLCKGFCKCSLRRGPMLSTKKVLINQLINADEADVGCLPTELSWVHYDRKLVKAALCLFITRRWKLMRVDPKLSLQSLFLTRNFDFQWIASYWKSINRIKREVKRFVV